MRPNIFARMFSKCLSQGVFAEAWKTGELVLLKGDGRLAEDLKSYRPITLLSVLGKLFEKIIARRIMCDIANTTEAMGEQYGFRRGLFTVDAHLALRAAVDSCPEKYVMAIFVDMAGSFDSGRRLWIDFATWVSLRICG